MATNMKKTTTASSAKSTVEKKVVAEKKKFDKNEMIPCKSLTCGELLMEGYQSKLLYKWADVNDVQEVEYQDLLYDVRTGNSFSRYPRFIIMDEDFVEQNAVLKEVYSKIYSQDDLIEILNLPQADLKKVVSELPRGVRDSIKTLAATMINNGTFDSINKIKILDEVFETNMLQLLLGD